jgi:acyl carrier protein
MNQSEFDQLVERTCSVTVRDPEAPFVDLGVDSLNTIALLMAVEEQLGIEIDPEALTESTLGSPASLWRYLQEQSGPDSGPSGR